MDWQELEGWPGLLTRSEQEDRQLLPWQNYSQPLAARDDTCQGERGRSGGASLIITDLGLSNGKVQTSWDLILGPEGRALWHTNASQAVRPALDPDFLDNTGHLQYELAGYVVKAIVERFRYVLFKDPHVLFRFPQLLHRFRKIGLSLLPLTLVLL